MPSKAPLVEVDIAKLPRTEWTKIVWAVLLRGWRYTFPPLLMMVLALTVFGVVVALIAVKAGLSPETVKEHEIVFELIGDVLGAAVGVYVFARNLRALPKLRLGAYRFALVRTDAVPGQVASSKHGT